MSEFILIFRRNYQSKELQPAPEQIQEHLRKWQEWFNNLAVNDLLARPVQRLDAQGRLLRSGPEALSGHNTELRESVGGLVIIKANDYDEAVEMAESCPVLELDGNVEIRELTNFNPLI